MTASRGNSRGSNLAERHHRSVAEALEKGRPGLGGAGATAMTRGDRWQARAREQRPAASPAGLWLSTRLWSVWEWRMVLEEARGGSIYS